MKGFVIDAALCNGCYNCQVACKDEHCSNDWTPYAKPQPETGDFWCRVIDVERGTIPKYKISYHPVICQHCVDAPCISSCPVEAIYTRSDGLVIIDPTKCTGCQLCVTSCPYGVIYFNTSLLIAQKCTGCAHLVDEGWLGGNDTRCSDACPTAALTFGEESDLDLTGAVTLSPEFGLTTRVHYKNLPKRFIAGTVYDPDAVEVVIGATCTLSGDGSATTTTDVFGDFWFEGLEVGTYSLEIGASGFTTYTKGSISTDKDVNLGDIPLS